MHVNSLHAFIQMPLACVFKTIELLSPDKIEDG